LKIIENKVSQMGHTKKKKIFNVFSKNWNGLPNYFSLMPSDSNLFLLKGNHFGGIYIGDAINNER
jgi:hypothetical protein